jgi:hypothetical protein
VKLLLCAFSLIENTWQYHHILDNVQQGTSVNLEHPLEGCVSRSVWGDARAIWGATRVLPHPHTSGARRAAAGEDEPAAHSSPSSTTTDSRFSAPSRRRQAPTRMERTTLLSAPLRSSSATSSRGLGWGALVAVGCFFRDPWRFVSRGGSGGRTATASFHCSEKRVFPPLPSHGERESSSSRQATPLEIRIRTLAIPLPAGRLAQAAWT